MTDEEAVGVNPIYMARVSKGDCVDTPEGLDIWHRSPRQAKETAIGFCLGHPEYKFWEVIRVLPTGHYRTIGVGEVTLQVF